MQSVQNIRQVVDEFSDDQSGATAIEYGLLAALIAVAIIFSVTQLGGANGGGWNGIATKVSDIDRRS